MRIFAAKCFAVVFLIVGLGTPTILAEDLNMDFLQSVDTFQTEAAEAPPKIKVAVVETFATCQCTYLSNLGNKVVKTLELNRGARRPPLFKTFVGPASVDAAEKYITEASQEVLVAREADCRDKFGERAAGTYAPNSVKMEI